MIKTEVGGQRTGKDRGRRSEIRGRRTEVRAWRVKPRISGLIFIVFLQILL